MTRVPLDMLCFALPKDEQPDFLHCEGKSVLIESEQFLLLILTPLAGCGAHAEGVLGGVLCDTFTIFSTLLGLPSTHTLGANVASRVLLCRMAAKR